MHQLRMARCGPPADAVELHPQSLPLPGPGEVRLRLRAAALNPADLNFIEGHYGRQPDLPCVPGMEGAGTIDALGEGVAGCALGSLALPLTGPGNWATWRILPAAAVLSLPPDLDPLQAALLRINPATAWGLLHAAGPPAPGSWVAQNAASSAAAHCVIQLARNLQLRTVNFVRRPESAAACQALGADLTFPDDAAGLAAARAALAGEAPPALALNAVGGDSALRLLDLLGPGGTHLTYGAMGRQALKVPNSMLIFKGLTLRGFWLSRWQEGLPPDAIAALYQKLAHWAASGQLRQQIAATYPLAAFRQALAHAAQSGRGGKVLFALP